MSKRLCVDLLFLVLFISMIVGASLLACITFMVGEYLYTVVYGSVAFFMWRAFLMVARQGIATRKQSHD